jgi:hypothetical protein
MTKLSSVQFDFISSVSDIREDAWARLTEDVSPFLEYGFLSALEQSGCVGEQSGWVPHILCAHLEEDGEDRLVGALPIYLKTHSAGEFVFDHSWADAAYRAGIEYYPKAVVAVPFTPITGHKLLVDPSFDDSGALKGAMIDRATQFVRDEQLSSIHFNFFEPEERPFFEDFTLPIRYGMQYHWYNGADLGEGEDYEDFAEFLSRFRSKKRSNIKRERRKLREAGVDVDVVAGAEVTHAHLDRMFDYYRDTIQKFYWGRQYLNRDFFHAAKDAFGDRIHMVVAEHDGQEYAGAFNLMKDGSLYGRYWGCLDEIKYTHFEVCLYKSVEWCIEHGFQKFEPGAQGDHKYDRGFQPTHTYSAHYIRDPRLRHAIEDYIRRESRQIDAQIEDMRESSPYKW